jgi:hypothetical protein
VAREYPRIIHVLVDKIVKGVYLFVHIEMVVMEGINKLLGFQAGENLG